MLCHKSTKLAPGEPKPICAGYALVVGYDSVGLRLASYNGVYDPKDYDAAGIPLHDSFEAMMRAQGIRLPKRNRLTQR